jgi:hypothetical protein
MSMVSVLRIIVFGWISCWNIALNSLRAVGRDRGSSKLGEARVGSFVSSGESFVYVVYVHEVLNNLY